MFKIQTQCKQYYILLIAFLNLSFIGFLNSNSFANDGNKPIFEENFEQGSQHWEMTDSNAWTVSKDDKGNHLLCLTGPSKYEPAVRSPKSIALIKDVEFEDFTLTVRAKQTGKEYGHRDLCFFFGYQDPTHFYYVHIATKADDHAHSIFLVNNEPRVSIAKERTKGADWAQDFHQITIVRDTKTGKIEVYYDDMEKPIMATEDKTFVKGKIGLGSFDDTGCFDDLKIWNTANKNLAIPK
ncbi:MAG TPA: hypothetical protein PLA12_08925 [Candidatus Hydrogenedens sp.]|nr:hypothetical protein [Candidatus Hydrogenedens sp.]